MTGIALIVPPSAGGIPPEFADLCPADIEVAAFGLGVPELTLSGYGTAIARAAELATVAGGSRPAALSLMGTSVAFFRGRRYEEDLRSSLSQAAQCPATSMAIAVVRALRACGVTRPAVVTAYIDEVNDRLEQFLCEWDLPPAGVIGLSMTGVDAVREVAGIQLVDAARSVCAARPEADGVLISCGGLPTLGIIASLEAELNLPVVTSAVAGLWDVLAVAGRRANPGAPGHLFRVALGAAGPDGLR